MKQIKHPKKTAKISLFTLTASIIFAQGQGFKNDNDNRRRGAAIPMARQRIEPRTSNQNIEHLKGDDENLVEVVVVDRSFSGVENNLNNPEWGAAKQTVIRLLDNAYADGISSPAGEDRPSARAISNAVIAQTESIINTVNASDYLWQWGQFLDHDIIETPAADPAEAFDIAVPLADIFFDPFATGTATIPLNRSLFEEHDGIREQVNEISAYIDGSQIYGSDSDRAYGLRTLDGTGKLKVSVSETHGDLLPYNTEGYANAPSSAEIFYFAGDVRANEQAALTALHTLFVREHNYWAEQYTAINPNAEGEEIFQYARMIVAAELQAITYREFIPVLLGEDALPRYRGYDHNVRVDISNEFGAAAFRIGHSMLSPNLLRVDADGNEIANGHLSLALAFFDPSLIEDDGIEPILRGLATQNCQDLDSNVIDEVRNFLFGPPGSGGFDLASLNIQRGRDHGIPSYYETRLGLGLQTLNDISEINSDSNVTNALSSVYDELGQIDLWVGGLAEEDLEGSLVGPTFQKILVDQFSRLRDGDRFYYENFMPTEMVQMIEEQTLSVIIKRNTNIADELQDDVFLTKIANNDAKKDKSSRSRSQKSHQNRSHTNRR